MWLNTPRLLRGWRRLRAGRSMDILERAVEERTLHPEEVREVPPAFFLEGALERITSVSPWRIPAVEEALVKGGSLPVRATRSWTLPEVTIVGPRIYSGPSYDHIGFGPERLVLRNPDPWRELDEAHLVSTWPGCNFFGCLLLDDFPIELLPPPSQPSVSMVTRPYAHHVGYREILGLEPPLHVDRGRFRRLTLYDEPPNNRAKAERYRRLRARLRASISGAGTNGGLIYLKRGATGDPRILANEAEVEDCLPGPHGLPDGGACSPGGPGRRTANPGRPCRGERGGKPPVPHPLHPRRRRRPGRPAAARPVRSPLQGVHRLPRHAVRVPRGPSRGRRLQHSAGRSPGHPGPRGMRGRGIRTDPRGGSRRPTPGQNKAPAAGRATGASELNGGGGTRSLPNGGAIVTLDDDLPCGARIS